MRAKEKGYADADMQRKGVTYGPWIFWIINEQENLL